MHGALLTRCWELRPQSPGIYRLFAKMAKGRKGVVQKGRLAPPLATSATESALRLRPRRALSSAQLSLEWTTIPSPRNDLSLNGAYPLFPVSQHWGAPQVAGRNPRKLPGE